MTTNGDRVILPDSAHPLRYEITLTPDLEGFVFHGEETIEIEITRSTTSLSLNSDDINVSSALITTSAGEKRESTATTYDKNRQTVTFNFSQTLPIGKASLELVFSGELNDRLHGFYRSTYETDQGETRILAATQFEPTDARRAFPCWDEPNKKARFQISLVIPSQLTAVSNTPILSDLPKGHGTKQVTFHETPTMSTYLVAFVVGELESIENTASNGTLLRVWTTPGKSDQGKFALEITSRLLDYYNDYFGVPYPLDKLDHIAIPDFAAGAMENWGAITYREVALLFDSENSSPRTMQLIAEIVAHEMAHMWFGDLVTMDWWDDLWLNESFASWMATKAVDSLYPEWDLWTQFISTDVNTGLSLDGLENSHPIKQTVKDPSEINQLFDAISYQKGASILRMLEQFLGPDKFRKGLQKYIFDHTYGNATGADLWKAIEEESGQPVIAMMNSWIDQVGYPYLQVKLNRKDPQSIEMSQSKFLYSGPSDDHTLWEIPVTVSIENEPIPVTLAMNTRNTNFDLQNETRNPDSWVKVNSGQTGFYRVMYQQHELALLRRGVSNQILPTADRLGLQSDAFALSKAGFIPATDFLDLAEAYIHEKEYAVWSDLASNLQGIGLLISEEPFYDDYKKFCRILFSKITDSVGWDKGPNENHLGALLRSTVLSSMSIFDDPETLESGLEKFHKYLEDPNSLSPDLRSTVFSSAARSGDVNTYTSIKRLFNEANLQEEKIRLLVALSNFKDPSLLEKTVDMSLSKEVRSQDSVSLVNILAANPGQGKHIAWEYAKNNWEEFDRRYGAGGFAMMRLVQIAGRFTTPDQLKDVETFFKEHPTPSASRTVEQSLERISLNIKWLENNRDSMAQWLKK